MHSDAPSTTIIDRAKNKSAPPIRVSCCSFRKDSGSSLLAFSWYGRTPCSALERKRIKCRGSTCLTISAECVVSNMGESTLARSRNNLRCACGWRCASGSSTARIGTPVGTRSTLCLNMATKARFCIPVPSRTISESGASGVAAMFKRRFCVMLAVSSLATASLRLLRRPGTSGVRCRVIPSAS